MWRSPWSYLTPKRTFCKNLTRLLILPSRIYLSIQTLIPNWSSMISFFKTWKGNNILKRIILSRCWRATTSMGSKISINEVVPHQMMAGDWIRSCNKAVISPYIAQIAANHHFQSLRLKNKNKNTFFSNFFQWMLGLMTCRTFSRSPQRRKKRMVTLTWLLRINRVYNQV